METTCTFRKLEVHIKEKLPCFFFSNKCTDFPIDAASLFWSIHVSLTTVRTGCMVGGITEAACGDESTSECGKHGSGS